MSDELEQARMVAGQSWDEYVATDLRTAATLQGILNALVAIADRLPETEAVVHYANCPGGRGCQCAAIAAVENEPPFDLAVERIALARHALVETGYFTADEVSDDVAPRITELVEAIRTGRFVVRENDVLCGCRHPKKDHVYEEGACRPGYFCPCEKFNPTTIEGNNS